MTAPVRQTKAPLGIGIAIILIVALLVRLGYLWYYRSLPEWPMLTVDNWYHHNWAQAIANGHIFGDTTYFRAPFYVWSLALVYALFGPTLWAARLFGTLLGVCSVAMTYLIGRRVFDHRTGLLAALLQTFTPIIVYFDGELLLDPLFTLLFQVAVLFFVKWRDDHKARDLLLSGLAFGLGAITRPTVLPLLIIPLWFLLRDSLPWRLRLRHVVMLLLGVVACVGLTLIRNVVVAGDPVLVSSQGGINFYIGNNDEADGLTARLPDPLGNNWRLDDIAYIAEQDEGRKLKQGEISTYWTRQTWAWIADHPVRFVELYLKKLYFSVSNREISNNRLIPAFFDEVPFLKYNPLIFAVIFPLAVIGAWYGWRRCPHLKFILPMVVLFIAASAFFFYNSRFRLPIMPYLIMLASAGAFATYELVAHRSRAIIIAASLGVASALLSCLPLMPLSNQVSVQNFVSAALYQYARGDFRQTIALCESALEYDPTFPELHLTIGTAYIRLGLLDSAQTHLESELRLHPKRSKAYANLASLYLLREDLPTAYRHAIQAVQYRPYDPTAQTLLIRIAGESPSVSVYNLMDFVRDGSSALGDDPRFLLEAAHAFALKGDSTECRRLLIRAGDAALPPIESDSRLFDPNYAQVRAAFSRRRAEALHLLSYSYGVTGEADRAVAAARRALSIDPGYSPAYLNLATGLRLLGHPTDADSVLDYARRNFPKDDFLRDE